MKDKIAEFAVYAFPSYWTLALTSIVLFVWKTPLTDPDLLSLIAVSAAILVAAFLLMKKRWWPVFPMIALSIFIAMQKDGFTDDIFLFFGTYMILHYTVCGIYVYRHRGEREE